MVLVYTNRRCWPPKIKGDERYVVAHAECRTIARVYDLQTAKSQLNWTVYRFDAESRCPVCGRPYSITDNIYRTVRLGKYWRFRR